MSPSRRPTSKKKSTTKPRERETRTLAEETEAALSSLKRLASKSTRDGMARYGIPNDKAFGVPVGKMRQLAKQLGPNHELALSLWKTGWYEARMLAAFLDEPEKVTSKQMDSWCKDFDNWAICDTVCFHLFDRTPYAWGKVKRWSNGRDEFVKRAAFALLASLAAHDKKVDSARFAQCLPLIEKAAADERNFVKKGVSWALRGMGRRDGDLHGAAIALAIRLSTSEHAAARWVGKDTLRDLVKAGVVARFKK